MTVIDKENLKMVKINIEKRLRRLVLGVEERMGSPNDSEAREVAQGVKTRSSVFDVYRRVIWKHIFPLLDFLSIGLIFQSVDNPNSDVEPRVES